MLASHWQSDVCSCVYDSYGERVLGDGHGDKWCASSLKAMQGATDEWSVTLRSRGVRDAKCRLIEVVCNDFVVHQEGPADIGVLILTAGRPQARSPAGAGAAPGGGATASSGAAKTEEAHKVGRGAPGQRPLTDAEEAEVDAVLSRAAQIEQRRRGPPKLLVEFHSIPVTTESMCTLQPLTWLNDEVINFFFKLLLAREEGGGGKHADMPTCHFMQTNFYPKLAEQSKGYCYKDVKRWTKQTDIFTKHLVIVPIHCHGNHWTLAVVNMKERRFEYYDSLRGPPDMVLRNLVTEAGLDRTPLPGCMGPLPPMGLA